LVSTKIGTTPFFTNPEQALRTIVLKKKKKILIILPRGEAYRNFLYSQIIEKLSKKYFIHLVAVYPNIQLKKRLSHFSSACVELMETKYSYPFELYNDIFDLTHNRYIWSEASKIRWQIRDAEAKTFLQKVIRLCKKNCAILLSKFDTINSLERLNQLFSIREESVIYWLKYLDNIRPDLVFNTSHSHASNSHPIVFAANALNIKTSAFLFSWDNLTSQGRIIPSYQYYFAWNNSIKADLLRIYPNTKPENVFVTGTPQFIGHFDESNHLSKEELKQVLGLKPEEKYFLYSSGMSHHLPEEPYVAERIADRLNELGDHFKLVIRTYAKDRFDVFKELKQRRPDIIIPEVQWEKNYQTPLEEDQRMFSSLLKHCVAGINVASTISLELCMFDKPAINVGYNPPGKNIYPYNYTRFYSFDHYKPIVDSGAVEIANNEDQLISLLSDAIHKPDKRSTERRKLILQFFENNLDGRVINNFLAAINDIINKSTVD
jgi:hypothetical protein